MSEQLEEPSVEIASAPAPAPTNEPTTTTTTTMTDDASKVSAILAGNPFKVLASTNTTASIAKVSPAEDAVDDDADAAAAVPPAVAVEDESKRGHQIQVVAASEEEAEASRKKAIANLLEVCAANDLSINENLRRAILGEELYDENLCDNNNPTTSSSKQEKIKQQREAFSKRESVLGALVRTHEEDVRTSAKETEISREIRGKMLGVKRSDTAAFEVRITDGSYTVECPALPRGRGGRQHIPTVTNTGGFSKIGQAMRRLATTGSAKQKMETKTIMEGINLVLKEGKMYLILGAPGCGKSTLLKMVAGLLPRDGKHTVGGRVEINGVNSNDTDIIWSNIVSYVDQIDRLHGYLTVKETLNFAFDCSFGGTHRGPFTPYPGESDDVDRLVREMDDEGWLVDLIMRAVGLKGVEDTFVGNDKVRGVSGGEKKRVTVAEMMAARTFVDCFDEISTGLDAATTFDICKVLGEVTRMRQTIKLVSLLQPPPETVALFDEIILLDGGRILYAGPVEEVTSHFKSLGYKQPDRMDPADWLQSLPTKDGAKFLTGPEETAHLTNEQFVQKYVESVRGQEMLEKMKVPVSETMARSMEHKMFRTRYANGTLRSIRVVFAREFLLWWRDKYARKARLIQDLFMGIVVGTVFWQVDDPQTVMGVVFQCVFFISMGAMLKVAPQIDKRGVFYKEQDANFYPTWTYVLARALASLPTSIQDSLVYGSIIYWFSGFAPSASNYFVFLLLVLLSAFATGLMFSVYSATIKDRPTAQACMSITLVIMILFSGFTVQPDVIPPYYIWIYWSNLFAWVIRAVVINEYQSGHYDKIVSEDGTTEGEVILERFGFTLNGEPFEYVWVWWTVLFCIGLCIVSNFASVWALGHVRFATGGSLGGDENTSKETSDEKSSTTDSSLETNGATLTFKDVNYTVKASTSKDKLHLLKGISGYFAAGKMTALMGSSGAGKTTLMDVLSLRKASGDVTGDIRINGHPQEPNSFRRMTGYVEQFDTQSPQLTVRETVEFSAKMRLDESIPIETKLKFVDRVLAMLELDGIAGFLVGNDTGGLSFEQNKRLSIAVELASNPSCIFLDEPTSGLDARAASIVMRSLRRIADSGIAVVATIHQPSVAIFNSFDSLLLLKRGGETVFFGELGEDSLNLIEYLESYPSVTPIKGGENPATWMLTCIGAGSAGSADSFDYAKAYINSPLASDCMSKIDSMNSNVTDESKITFPNKYATSTRTQSIEVCKRMSKIYWRSPGYNRVRLLVSGVVALLFGSVFASQRVPQNESDMNSRVTSIYITALFLGVNAMNTVLPVFEMERNMFYRHKASLTYDHKAINLAFTVVELPFILLSSMVFCLLWYFTVGFAIEAGKFFLYWVFTTFSLGVFTFFGQAFMAIFRDSQTAQGFGSLLIGMNSIFGGVLIRPQHINSFWVWAYWTFPLHYVLEGLLTSQFRDDTTPITASFGTPFYDYTLEKNCPDIEFKPDDTVPPECTEPLTAEDWIFASFGGYWIPEHIPYDILYLIGAVVVAKAMAFYGLKQKNFLAK